MVTEPVFELENQQLLVGSRQCGRQLRLRVASRCQVELVGLEFKLGQTGQVGGLRDGEPTDHLQSFKVGAQVGCGRLCSQCFAARCVGCGAS